MMAPAFAGWHAPELGIVYSMPSYGNAMHGASDLAAADALNFSSGPATILTLRQTDTFDQSGFIGLTLNYDLTRYLTLEANYFGDTLGGGADFTRLDGTDFFLEGTARQNGQIRLFDSRATINTRWYGGALLGYWPVWRGLNVLARAGLEHTRTEVSNSASIGYETCIGLDELGRPFKHRCGDGEHTESNHSAARNVAQVGVGLAYRWKGWATVTMEYDRTLTKVGDAQTGRYAVSAINVGVSFVVTAFTRD